MALYKTQKQLKEAKSQTASKQKKPITPGAMISFPKLLQDTWELLKKEWKLYLGLGVLYLVMYIAFAKGVSKIDLLGIKNSLHTGNNVVDIAALTGTAFSASSASSQESAYGVILVIVFGLSTVWATRQILAGQRVKIRDALYNCMTPLIPVLVVMVVMALQALPMAVAIFIYGAAQSSGILVNPLEIMAALALAVLATVLSLFWLSSSAMALMAATLPGMYPWAALRAGRELVRGRRWQVIWRIVVFVALLVAVWLALLMVTVSNTLTIRLTGDTNAIMKTVALVVGLVFTYKLYRSLVDEEA